MSEAPGTPPGRPRLPGTSPPDRGTQRVKAFWRATAPLMFAATVLFGLVAAVGGPIVLYELIVRGVREHRWSWLGLGVLCAIPWLLVVFAALRRALRGSGGPKSGANGTSGGNHVRR